MLSTNFLVSLTQLLWVDTSRVPEICYQPFSSLCAGVRRVSFSLYWQTIFLQQCGPPVEVNTAVCLNASVYICVGFVLGRFTAWARSFILSQ